MRGIGVLQIVLQILIDYVGKAKNRFDTSNLWGKTGNSSRKTGRGLLKDKQLSILNFLRSVNFKKTFWYSEFFRKLNEKIQPNYYDTSGRIVFVRFLE